jgi:hypothetical protein
MIFGFTSVAWFMSGHWILGLLYLVLALGLTIKENDEVI